jgi:AAA family ATP:ADP antiporter
LTALTEVFPEEQEKAKPEPALIAIAFAWFFCILCSYYVIRPIRETMGVASGSATLNWLFLTTFVVMLVAVPIYAACVARLRRNVLVGTVYRFFIINLLLFWWSLQSVTPEQKIWVGRAFFVWVSVFGLYATSVFWSVLTDLFGSTSAKQSFGFVAAGGTVGAITGSLVASFLSKQTEIYNLLLVPVVMLEIGLWFASWLQKRAALSISPERKVAGEAKEVVVGEATGGGIVDGVSSLLRSPYLRWICLALFLGQLCGTYLYIQQSAIVGAAIPDEAGRTKLFANMNLGVQLLTLGLQATVVGLLTRKAGLFLALSLTPLVYLGSFTALCLSPTLAVFVVADIVCRGFTYGVAVPTREVLFTVVTREEKYKSKGFIDTVILRGGDAISSQLIAGIKQLFSSSIVVQLAAIPVALLWIVVSLRLAAWQRILASGATTERQVS